MANSKISALTSATTPLAGTETLPIVQSSATVKVAVSDLTAGRVISVAGITDTGNLTFTGTGNRITGDFSNTPLANRVYVQTSATNSNTNFGALPSGTATTASLSAWNNSDPTNAAFFVVQANGSTDVRLNSGITGTGTYLPMTFYTSGTEKLRIAADTTGTITIGGTAPRILGDFSNATLANRVAFQTSTTNGNTNVYSLPNGTSTTAAFSAVNNPDPTNASFTQLLALSTESSLRAAISGTGTYLPITFYTSGLERLRFFVSGGVSIGNTTDPGATNLSVTGNVIQGTAARGFNFTANTPAAGMTSQLLNWYEEGTWTPNQGAGLTLVGAFSSTGRYTRIGRQVSISGTVTGATSVAVTAAGVITSNLPFTVVTAGHGDATNGANNASATVICTSTSVTSAAAIAATGTITFSATYFV